MIKLIASDMDGTLLDRNGCLPPNFFEILDKLKSKGVCFTAASGRSYEPLFLDFAPHSESLSYIADNGTCVVHEGKLIYKNTLSKEYVKEVVKACEKLEGVYLILCGVNGAYMGECPWTSEEIDKYYKTRAVVDDLSCVDDEIFKIGICDIKGATNNSYAFLAPIFSENLTVVRSGAFWTDVMNLNVNKGEALKKLQGKLGISEDETMAFGDYYNDIEMLKRAKYSFVMETADDEIKKHGNFIAKGNHEYGVVKAIQEYVLGE